MSEPGSPAPAVPPLVLEARGVVRRFAGPPGVFDVPQHTNVGGVELVQQFKDLCAGAPIVVGFEDWHTAVGFADFYDLPKVALGHHPAFVAGHALGHPTAEDAEHRRAGAGRGL